MPNTLLSTSTIIDKIERQHSQSGIDSTIPGTFTHSLVNPIKDAVADMNRNIVNYYNRGILELANDKDLEEKAKEFATLRTSSSILADNTTANFNIFIKKGVAKDYALDPELPITISKIQILITDNNQNYYAIMADAQIQPNNFAVFLPIISLTSGLTSVGANTIQNIRVTLLDQIQNIDPTKLNTLEFGCNNNLPISANVPSTSDEDVRRRAFLRINSINNTNIDALRLALENIGITDVDFVQDYFGFGTIGVMARIAGASTLSEDSIQAINNIVSNVVPSARVIAPESLVTKLTLDVQFKDGNTVATSKVDILSQLQNHFQTLLLGDSLDPEILTNIILSIPNVSKAKIRCMFIDDRKCTVRKQFALADQVFVLHNTNPIEYSA